MQLVVYIPERADYIIDDGQGQILDWDVRSHGDTCWDYCVAPSYGHEDTRVNNNGYVRTGFKKYTCI